MAGSATYDRQLMAGGTVIDLNISPALLSAANQRRDYMKMLLYNWLPLKFSQN